MTEKQLTHFSIGFSIQRFSKVIGHFSRQNESSSNDHFVENSL